MTEPALSFKDASQHGCSQGVPGHYEEPHPPAHHRLSLLLRCLLVTRGCLFPWVLLVLVVSGCQGGPTVVP